jgi:hypothetical protein
METLKCVNVQVADFKQFLEGKQQFHFVLSFTCFNSQQSTKNECKNA